MITDVLTY